MNKPILFLSSDDIAYHTIHTLVNKYSVFLATKSDKPQKRSSKPQVNALVNILEKNSMSDSLTIIKIAKDEKQWWQQWSADKFSAIITFSFGKILPDAFLDYWQVPVLNIHPSRLPDWRGPSPLQQVLLADQNKTALTYMLMSPMMDGGDILQQTDLNIGRDWTIRELREAIAKLSSDTILKFLQDWHDHKLMPQAQDNARATYCKLIKKNDGKIDWQNSSHIIYNQYRAFINWPGIFCQWQGKLIFLKKISLSDEPINLQPGEVAQIKNALIVGCGQGNIQIIELQLAGKKNMPAAEFLRGHNTFAKTILT